MGDSAFMLLALELAGQAAEQGEVPVGAVVVYDGDVIGRGFNSPVARNDPSAHAEILALREAAQSMGNYRLPGCELFSTLEPCTMCAGAILHARIDRLIFAARDDRAGAAGSVVNLLESPLLNHRCKVVAGVQSRQAKALLQSFFRERRR